MDKPELELLTRKLSKLSPLRKMHALFQLRASLDDESFRYAASLLAVDLSRVDNPKRWSPVEDLEQYAEDRYEEFSDGDKVLAENEEVIEDDEYVGQSVVRRIWRLST